MTNLRAQRRLAADVLGVGENRIWFDPTAQGDIADAITREDIRELVETGIIDADEPRGNSRGRARKRAKQRSYGHKKGHGKRKGRAGARKNPKSDWTSRIRAQRRELRSMRDDGEISKAEYRRLYDMASGGEFDSVADIRRYVTEQLGEQ